MIAKPIEPVKPKKPPEYYDLDIGLDVDLFPCKYHEIRDRILNGIKSYDTENGYNGRLYRWALNNFADLEIKPEVENIYYETICDIVFLKAPNFEPNPHYRSQIQVYNTRIQEYEQAKKVYDEEILKYNEYVKRKRKRKREIEVAKEAEINQARYIFNKYGITEL